jgi:ubiquinone biosynthesis protein
MRDPVRELATWTRDELDYRREASHCNLLAVNAEETPTERLPKIYWELTASRVLTMEFLEGVSVSEYLRAVESGSTEIVERLRATGFIPAQFSHNVIGNFLRDAFRHGVFHADLHPANLLILPNNVVGYVDFGIVAKLTAEARRKQIELSLSYSRGNEEEIYRGFLSICIVGPEADLAGMRSRIARMVRTWYEEPTINGKVKFRLSITLAMMDLLTICREYGVLVDREMIKYIRSVFLTDGLVQRLAPGFDIAQALRVVIEDYLVAESRRQVLSPAGGLSLMTDLLIWMRTGPGGMVQAMDLVERRKVWLHGRVTETPNKSHIFQTRALASGLIWAFSVLFLAISGGLQFSQMTSAFGVIAIVFVTSWTLWVTWLIRRVTAEQPA